MRKYLIPIIMLLMAVMHVDAQTVNERFSGYGVIQGRTGTGPSYTLNIVSFQGSPRFQPNGTWLGTDVLVGDVVWIDCGRYVITAKNSAGISSMNVTVQIPAADVTAGVTEPPTGQVCAVMRELPGAIPAFPVSGDNAGSGIPITLSSCILSHYAGIPKVDSVRTTSSNGGVVVKVNTVSAPAVEILPGAIASGGATSGQVLKFDGSNWAPGTDNNSGGSSGGNLYALDTVTQTAHGFRVMDAVLDTSTTSTNKFIKGNTSNQNLLPSHLVVDSLSANTFVVQRGGYVKKNQTRFTARQVYYLRDDGNYASLPDENYNFPVFSITATTTPIYLTPFVGGSGGGSGIVDSVRASSTNNGIVVKVNQTSSPAVEILPGAIAQAGATSGNALKWNGSNYAPGNIAASEVTFSPITNITAITTQEAITETSVKKDLYYNQLRDTLPWNVIKGEGTATVTSGPIPQSYTGAGCNVTYVSAPSSIPNSVRLKYNRRIRGNVATGSCFASRTITWPSPKPTKFGWGFWVNNLQVDTIYPGTTAMQWWLYTTTIVGLPSFAIRDMIQKIGNSATANFSVASNFSGTWTATCIDKKDGYSYIAINITNLVYDPAYTSPTWVLYDIKNNVTASLNNRNFDYIGFTWLWGETITSSSVYPDGGVVLQYPYPTEKATTSVTSFNGRGGAITPVSGDYTASTIPYTPSGGSISTASTTTQLAVDELSKVTRNNLLAAGDTLPWNVIKGEGTATITGGPIPQSLGTTGFTSAYVPTTSNMPNSHRLKYYRRLIGNAASGNCFWVTPSITWPTPKPTQFGWGFWVSDTQIDTVFPGTTQKVFWIYQASFGQVIEPSFQIRNLIQRVGNTSTANFNSVGKVSGTWTATCLDKRNGYSYIAVNITNLVFGVDIATTFTFYDYMQGVVANLNGRRLDYIGFTWLWGNTINTSSVYPDGGAVQQYPVPTQYVDKKFGAIDATLATSLTSQTAGTIIDSLYSGISVLKSGSSIYVRSPYNSTQDLVHVLGYSTGSQINLGARVVPKSSSINLSVYSAAEVINSGSDDAAPISVNGTYIGANHGCSDLRVVTATAHGKTTADVGSKWRDAASKDFFLVKIVNANDLWFLSVDTSSSGDIWKHVLTITGNLTHVSGATNTGTITVASYVGGQMMPAIKNCTNQYLLDGKKPITADGIYYGQFLDIINNYDIVDPSSAALYLSTHIGTTDLTQGDTFVGQKIVHRIDKWGTVLIMNDVVFYKTANLGYFGFTQVSPLSTATYPNRKFYYPRTLPVSDGATSWDFRTLRDFTTFPAAALNFTSAFWETSGFVPERAIEYIANGSNLIHGFAHGFVPTLGVGDSIQRFASVNNAGFIFTSGKNYPFGIDTKIGSPVTAGTWKSAVAYRRYFDASANSLGKKSSLYYYTVGSETFVYVDYHTTVKGDKVSLPAELRGKKISVVYKSSNLTINSQFSTDGIFISMPTGSYGFVCLKLI